MSVHWKPMVDGSCTHCGRILAGRGCVCPESSAQRRPQSRQTKAKESPFWDQDHFGLMERYKERQ